MTGIYIHIPFCSSKCPYCDFYSFKGNEEQKDSYLKAVLSALRTYEDTSLRVDTIYFGGGTPSVFGAERIEKILNAVRGSFSVVPEAEITVECNPSSVTEAFAEKVTAGGVNRISMGMQSVVKKEREALGRASDRQTVLRALELFRERGIENISLDLMLGVPHQTMESLQESLDFILSCRVPHVSTYMLKIEEGTPFYEKANTLSLADEDTVCDMYLYTSELLSRNGFSHYEISNLAREGFESRHNLKYWLCREYIGIGPSAHSFFKGKRFYYPRCFDSFLKGEEVIYDGEGGDEREFILLSLRLSRGLENSRFRSRFGRDIPEEIFLRAEKFRKAGLVEIKKDSLHLTKEGFLLSNTIISELI